MHMSCSIRINACISRKRYCDIIVKFFLEDQAQVQRRFTCSAYLQIAWNEPTPHVHPLLHQLCTCFPNSPRALTGLCRRTYKTPLWVITDGRNANWLSLVRWVTSLGCCLGRIHQWRGSCVKCPLLCARTNLCEGEDSAQRPRPLWVASKHGAPSPTLASILPSYPSLSCVEATPTFYRTTHSSHLVVRECWIRPRRVCGFVLRSSFVLFGRMVDHFVLR